MTEIIAKTGMGVLLVATVPIGGDGTAWSQWGLAGLVVGYTLWRDWHRERHMSKALEKHEEWVRTKLLGALERNTVAMERMAAHLDRMSAE